MRHEPPDPQHACIYCRMSEDREGGGLGIGRQREDCEKLAAQLGLTVVRVYTDNDLSAYSGKPRPDYQHMLDDLRNNMYGTVLAWHTDRLHRRPTELEEYIDVCEPRGIATRTVQAGAIDLTTAAGRLMARQLGSMARYEVEHMIERQRRAREQKVQRGEYCGGPRPYGWENDGVTPVPAEIAVIRETADAVLAGASIRSLAADLNERGMHSSTGTRWDGGTLSRMLRRPRNAGILQHRGEEAGPAQWDAALDEPTWRSLRAVLDDPSRIPAASNVRRYLGSGLYVCGVCGATLTSFSKGGGKPAKYKCRKNDCVLRDLVLLDKWVVGALLKRLKEPDAADFFTAREDAAGDVRGAQDDLKAARKDLDELAAAFGAGEIDMQEWRVARASARTRKERAEAVLATAVRVNPVAALLDAADIEARWEAFDLSRQRAAVDWAMTVRVLPARVGRRPGGSYWDADAVRLEWKK
ncbi:recombinase family protein [Streptomyces sp. ID05-04B]|uniref:recombinase family protein n=1 Tax=Streptomyces sp. ID05-04B TaxID=3028661 RepID=UPI0029C3A1EA|nr:recombinase family protein [Streptomyces sp. ID05-04B]MDX5563797.1 recombinase family protein [Streptomyces sp. ID05-04B]